MERHHEYVRAVDGALQVTPEVLHAVGVDVALHILHGMIYDLVKVLFTQTLIRFQGIGEQFRSSFHVGFDVGLENVLLTAIDYGSPHGAATFQHANHHRLVLAASPGDLASLDVLVHVPGFLADERLIDFDTASRLVEQRSGL